MKVYKLFLILALPLMAGCANSEKAPTPTVDENVLPIKPSGELVRGYALSNDFLDVDLMKVEKATLFPASRSEDVTEEDFAKAKAVVYRFYKHVTLKDSTYVCSLKNGAEINISEELFNFYLNGLQEANAHIKELNAKGQKVIISEPDEKYLESLLQ